eukprot:TRINITY_DN1110_c0_g1_i1.p1 TRINITY_DN1110_c0_g1~~TRINITY_DN1110_c0_g1_i1.p1  ORF type:complete len:432 (-),score=111.58 TRINITY_DN1110_c0_g1_i1:76-1371(-)
MKAVLLFALLICVCAVFAELGGKRALVLLDDSYIESSHSKFFKSLKERGYSLKYQELKGSEAVKLSKFGQFEYDHVILFAPSADIDSDEFIEFVDHGGNLLIGANSDVSDSVREVASACGIDLDDTDTIVVDHVNFEAQDYDSKHTLIIADQDASASLILGEAKVAPVLFRGVGAKVRDHALNYPLLKASPSAYVSKLTGSKKQTKVGRSPSLVAALQARNHARVVVSGSLDLFSDSLYDAPVKKIQDGKTTTVSERSGNEDLANIITRWVFQEKGALRSRNLQHNLVGGSKPDMYTIKDNVEFSVIIEEWNGKEWVPYQANDVQLEVRMLDPYIRTTLKNDGKGRFYTIFTLPDVYGVFTFRIDYQRPGYAGLHTFDRIPVRPFRHNQYERFIDSAYPYYAGAFSMLVGLCLFSAVFLYHKDTPSKVKTN